MHLARVGHETRLWARDSALADDMRRRRANGVYLPEIPFPETLEVTSALDEAVAEAELVVSAVPSHGTRGIIRRTSVTKS